MAKIAKSLRRSCSWMLLESFFINFNFENDRSALANVTGNVKNNIKAVATSVALEVSNGCFIKNSKTSFIEFNFWVTLLLN